MKVLLINPPKMHIAKSSALWDLEIENIGAYPPVGLMYIAANLRKNTRHQIEILDTVVDKMSYSGIETKIRDYMPDIVGITACTLTFFDVLKTAKLVKEINPEIHVNVGGPHVYFFPEETLVHPEIDSLVLGEGEFIFTNLVEALANGKDLKSVEGLVLRIDGKVTKTGKSGYIEDINKLPFPAFELVPFKKYYSSVGTSSSVASICSSRGCPFRCTYCVKPDSTYRMRTAENILEEMQLYYSQGIREFFFFDDLFNINPRRVIDISNEILRRGLKITWGFRGRVDRVSEEMFNIANKSGCRFVSFGVEDYTDEGLKLIKKGITVKQVLEAVHLAKKAGIKCNTDWIIGLPHHKSKEDILKLVDFAIKVNPDYAEFTILIPYYGTGIYNDGIKKGILTPGTWHSFVKNPVENFLLEIWEENMDRYELSKLYKKCFSKFYFRPGYIFKNLIELKNPVEFKRKVKGALKLAGLTSVPP